MARELDVVHTRLRLLDGIQVLAESPMPIGVLLAEDVHCRNAAQLPGPEQLRGRSPHGRGGHAAVAGDGGGAALHEQVQAGRVVENSPIGMAVDIHPAR